MTRIHQKSNERGIDENQIDKFKRMCHFDNGCMFGADQR